MAARREEIAYYKAMGAFTKVPISQCVARTERKPIGVRWRDINKGDRYNVNVRSRLVAKEFNNKKCDDLFAGTPPVEAMRAIISMAASGATPKTLMTVDVSRAFLHAKCKSEMYVELCPEALKRMEMRNAAGGWQRPCTAREVPRRTGSTKSNGECCRLDICRESRTRACFTTLLQKLHVWCTVTTSWLWAKNQH